MKLLFFPLTCLFLSFATAHAGVVNGGGGIGVDVGGKVEILDLYEIGLAAPIYDTQVKLNADLQKVVDAGIPSLDAGTRRLVTAKLSEVYGVNQGLAYMLAFGLNQYSWFIVNRQLENTNDDDSPVSIPESSRVQLAVRQGSFIYINQTYWNNFTAQERAVLVLHEMLYAYAEPQLLSGHENSDDAVYVQESADARAVNGVLFSGPASKSGAQLSNVLHKTSLRALDLPYRYTLRSDLKSAARNPYVTVETYDLNYELESGASKAADSICLYPLLQENLGRQVAIARMDKSPNDPLLPDGFLSGQVALSLKRVSLGIESWFGSFLSPHGPQHYLSLAFDSHRESLFPEEITINDAQLIDVKGNFVPGQCTVLVTNALKTYGLH